MTSGIPHEDLLRRVSGESPRGGSLKRSSDFDGSEGETYLFFLSNGMYRYSVEYPHLSAEAVDLAFLARDKDRGFRYVSVYDPIRVPDDRRGDFEAQLREARRIGQLIRANSNR